MDWIRENKVLATVMGIALAGAIGLAAMLFMSYSGYSQSMEEFQTTDSSLAAIKGRKLAPNQENLDKKTALVTEYTEAVNNLGTALISLQPQVKPISDTEFQVKLKERVANIRAAAAAANLELPADFAFGFGEYVGGLPRNAEAATALSDYLDGVESIIQTMVDAGVKKLTAIDRTALAVEKGEPPPKPAAPAPTRKQQRAKAGSKAAKPVPVVKEIAAVVEPRTISLTFTTDQVPLQVVMNALASPSKTVHFTAVRLLRIENEKQDGPAKSAIQIEMSRESGVDDESQGAPPPAVPAGGAAATASGARVIEPVLPAKKDAIDVLGAEMLNVYMEIDLIRFLEPSEETAEKK